MLRLYAAEHRSRFLVVVSDISQRPPRLQQGRTHRATEIYPIAHVFGQGQVHCYVR